MLNFGRKGRYEKKTKTLERLKEIGIAGARKEDCPEGYWGLGV